MKTCDKSERRSRYNPDLLYCGLSKAQVSRDEDANGEEGDRRIRGAVYSTKFRVYGWRA